MRVGRAAYVPPSVTPSATPVVELDAAVPSLIDLIAHSGADEAPLPTLTDSRELQASPSPRRPSGTCQSDVDWFCAQRLQLLSAQVASERRRGDNLFRELELVNLRNKRLQEQSVAVAKQLTTQLNSFMAEAQSVNASLSAENELLSHESRLMHEHVAAASTLVEDEARALRAERSAVQLDLTQLRGALEREIARANRAEIEVRAAHAATQSAEARAKAELARTQSQQRAIEEAKRVAEARCAQLQALLTQAQSSLAASQAAADSTRRADVGALRVWQDRAMAAETERAELVRRITDQAAVHAEAQVQHARVDRCADEVAMELSTRLEEATAALRQLLITAAEREEAVRQLTAENNRLRSRLGQLDAGSAADRG